MKVFLRISFTAVFAFVSGLAVTGQAVSTKPAYTEIFQAAWSRVNENFFDPGFVGVDWKAVGERYRKQAEGVRNDREFLALMQKMLKELPVSHLQIGMPRESGLTGIGVRTWPIGGRQIVVFVPPGSDAQAKGVRLGDELLDPAKEVGRLGGFANVRVKGCDGKVRSLEVRRESHSQPERPSIRWRTFSTTKGQRIGYLRAIRFDDDAAPLIDAAMAELKDAATLIIDVRDNTGGNMSFVRLSSYFSEGEHLVAALVSRPYLDSRGTTPTQIDVNNLPKATRTYTTEKVLSALGSNGGAVAVYSEDLGKDRYRGKVVVLINEETGSAAEGFAWHMKKRTDATLIGRKTAGALLGAEYFTLPGGWRLGVPTHSGWGPDGKPVIDQPVKPRIETKWTLTDVCSGTDPDIAKALSLAGAGT
ncbi:MAG: S41 family peptidase [Pyrinomonadaceae bacterium]